MVELETHSSHLCDGVVSLCKEALTVFPTAIKVGNRDCIQSSVKELKATEGFGMDPATYGAKLFNYIGAGCAAISIAMAAETGVLDVLLNAASPLSSQEIADRKGLKERYVRELLGSLVTAEVIQVDKDSTKYHVPETLKPALKGTAQFSRLVPHFGQRFKGVEECFQNDGPKGVDFAALPEIFRLMEGYRTHGQDKHIEEDILGVVPGLKEKLEKGIAVAEFGCASGIILNNLAARFPQSTFTGNDVDRGVLEKAKKNASDKHLRNVTYELFDLYNLPEETTNKFDWIYVDDVIHDLAYPDKALSRIRGALKPGGIFSMLDLCRQGSIAENSGNLSSCFLLTSSMLVCLPASSQYENSAQLGPSWTDGMARGYLERAGFKIVKTKHNEHDKHLVHFVCEA